jgi:hypothetical protein
MRSAPLNDGRSLHALVTAHVASASSASPLPLSSRIDPMMPETDACNRTDSNNPRNVRPARTSAHNRASEVMWMEQGGEQRFERWMLEIAKRLGARGVGHTKPTYDGRVLGERIALTWGGMAAMGELLVLRRERVARIVLLASSAEAALTFHEAVSGMHREVRRVHNAKRKFLHRVERMSEHLHREFAPRSGDAPADALHRLQALFQEAQLLVGVEVKRPGRADDDADVGPAGAPVDAGLPIRKGLQRRYRTRYAAALPATTGMRAALWSSTRACFVPSPVSMREVRRRLAAAQRPLDAASDFALAFLAMPAAAAAAEVRVTVEAPPDPSAQAAADAIDASIDVVSTAVDVADAAGACSDVGGIDLPDCGSIDVPDCSW